MPAGTMLSIKHTKGGGYSFEERSESLLSVALQGQTQEEWQHYT